MPRPAVALLIETSNAYARGILEGIIAYVREHDSWSIYLPEQRRGDAPPSWLATWQGNGIIARIENSAIARLLLKTGLPVIDVSAARAIGDVPWVETDDAAIARLAAEHLLERGFQHLAFCGDNRFNWSQWRQVAFAQQVKTSGGTCHVYPSSPTPLPWDQEIRQLAAWLKTLPRPVGIMACYDIRGQQLLDACRELAIAVPEEVAVIGVDNDHLLCDLCTPSLSSVIPNTYRTGYLAAELLDRRLAGEILPAEGHLIQPQGIATRQSTDVLAIDDREMAVVLRYIREHAFQGINVADVVRQTPLSRRVLESRFRQAVGRTPHEEIVRLRIDRAKHLLKTTDLTLSRIADRTGFAHVEYLSVAFKRTVGLSPKAFRDTSILGTP